jgi:hypothetical protein
MLDNGKPHATLLGMAITPKGNNPASISPAGITTAAEAEIVSALVRTAYRKVAAASTAYQTADGTPWQEYARLLWVASLEERDALEEALFQWEEAERAKRR